MDERDIETVTLTLLDMVNELLGILHEHVVQPDLNEARARLLSTVESLDAEVDELLLWSSVPLSANGGDHRTSRHQTQHFQ